MTSVTEALRVARGRMIAIEVAMAEAMIDHYELAWQYIERELDIVGLQIDAARARGETVNRAWLERQSWWEQSQQAIEREMDRFAVSGQGTLAATQSAAVATSATVTSAYRRLAGGPFAGGVRAGVMERWVSILQPGSPLIPVLNWYGERVSEAVRRYMTEGLGSGQGVGSVVRNIMADVGPDAVEWRMTTLVRTEGMRAYRGASRDDQEELGRQIPGTHEWEWLCALSDRTCLACLAMHRQRFPFDQYPERFHPGCRCVVRLVIDESIVPRVGMAGMTGEEWLLQQSSDVQQRVLRSDDRYEAWQSGVPLIAFTEVRHDPVWGSSIAIKPMRKLRDAA